MEAGDRVELDLEFTSAEVFRSLYSFEVTPAPFTGIL